MHVLYAHGSKAKRVSYSISHAETLSMVNRIESTILITTRISELMHHVPAPDLKQLVVLQENGNPSLPGDFYMDCNGLWQLITGQKTLPQDKVQRLYVLGIRECRLVGRLRLLTLVPTTAMLSDALTKAMVSPQLLRLLTCGKVDFHNVPDHPVKTRTLPTLPIEEESDLLLTDEEVMKVAELKPNKVTTTAASILLGLIAGATSQKLMVASTMAAMTTAATAQPIGGNNADDGDHGGHLALYVTLFLTVVLAIIVEKIISGFFKKPPTAHLIVPKVEQIRAPPVKRHREGDEAEAGSSQF